MEKPNTAQEGRTNLSEEDERERLFLSSDVPKDAKVISLLLKSINITDYEPKVINQLMEFMHRKPQLIFFCNLNILFFLGYVAEVLLDAEEYKIHAGRDQIDIEDLKLAVQSRVSHSFIQPPPRQVSLSFLGQDQLINNFKRRWWRWPEKKIVHHFS